MVNTGFCEDYGRDSPWDWGDDSKIDRVLLDEQNRRTDLYISLFEGNPSEHFSNH